MFVIAPHGWQSTKKAVNTVNQDGCQLLSFETDIFSCLHILKKNNFWEAQYTVYTDGWVIFPPYQIRKKTAFEVECWSLPSD